MFFFNFLGLCIFMVYKVMLQFSWFSAWRFFVNALGLMREIMIVALSYAL